MAYTDNGSKNDGNLDEVGNGTGKVTQELEERMCLLLNQFVATKGLAAAADLVVGETLERVCVEEGLQLGRDFFNVFMVGLLLNLDVADLAFFSCQCWCGCWYWCSWDRRLTLCLNLGLFTHSY